MMIYFNSLNDFLGSIKKFERFLMQCIDCKKIWIVPEVFSGKVQLSEEESFLLQSCVSDMNSWCPCIDELKELGIFISHGSCRPCIRNRMLKLVRDRQIKQGLYPCFGTAIDGHCSQNGKDGRPKCLYYNSCVVTRRELEIWEREHEQEVAI